MDGCNESRDLMFRVAEGEADPDEALRVARHLPTCTTCRILLAREIRLARVLESLDDAIPVEEAFLDEVMRALPAEPTRTRAALRPALRSGLKLAGLVGIVTLGAAGAARLTQILATTELRSPLARLQARDLEGFLATAAGAARMAFALVDRMSAGLVVDFPPLQVGSTFGVAAYLPGVIAIAALSTLLALFARAEPRR